MKIRFRFSIATRASMAALLGLVTAGLCAVPLRAEETKPTIPTEATANAATNSPAIAPANKAEKKLTGAELYAINCNRCHAERYPTEYTASQWETIMLEMRVRANLPAKQARAILKYLKEDAGGN